MKVGIDSSDKEFTGVIIGKRSDVDGLYKDMYHVFRDVGGTGNMHWQELKPNQKKLFHKKVFPKLKESGVSFIVIKHKKPAHTSRKQFYLEDIPSEIAEAIHPLIKEHRGSVQFHVGDDYNVKKVKNSSEVFLKKIVHKLTKRITNKNLKIFEKNLRHGVRFKNANGEKLELEGNVAGSSSHPIQVSDMFLGLYRHDKKIHEFKKKKYMRIADVHKI